MEGGKEESQGGKGKDNQPRCGNCSDCSYSDDREIEEDIVDEAMKGTSVDLVNFYRELFLTVLLDIPCKSMHKMTNLILE